MTAESFYYGAIILVGLMLVFARVEPRVGRRPPSHPPGWKNRQRKKG